MQPIGKRLALVTLVIAAAMATATRSPALADEAAPAEYAVSPALILEFLADASRFTLLDARSEGEYAASHIAGAINMPRDRIDELRRVLPSDPDALIVTYCKTGARANLLKLELQDRGYNNVRILEPEQIDWSDDAATFK